MQFTAHISLGTAGLKALVIKHLATGSGVEFQQFLTRVGVSCFEFQAKAGEEVIEFKSLRKAKKYLAKKGVKEFDMIEYSRRLSNF